MATRNKARKSTGPRGAQRPSTSGNNTSNTQNQRRRRTANANFSLQRLPSSSSESEAETQPLNIQNHHSSPGPSGINRLRIRSSSDSDPDGPTQRPTRGKKTKIVQRPESSSSGPTTSDSDEIPGRDSIQKENMNTRAKRKKITKPGATIRRKRTRKPSSSSEADEASKTSPSKRLILPQGRNISSLVNKCVYFLLIADQKKHVIKKTEILKHVFSNQSANKMYAVVMQEANEVLKKTYGMEIIKTEKRKGEYMLINALNRDIDIQDFVELSPLELQKQGLIFYILTVIFMNENSINENDLWEALKPLGIDATSKVPHPIFGDVQKYITNELVKQMYLEYKCISKDPPEFEFTLGERVKQVVEKKHLLDFACKIMGDTSPQEWLLQYNDAMDATRENE